MPGKQESPHMRRPATGVFGKGKEASPATIAGPYEPRYLFKNRWWVNGVLEMEIMVRIREQKSQPTWNNSE